MEVKQYQPGQIKTRQIDNRSMMSANATAESFGMGNARTIAGLADVANNAAQYAAKRSLIEDQETAKADARKVLNDVRDNYRTKWDEISRLQGEDAKNAYENFKTYAKELRASSEEKLDSQYKKDLFAASFDEITNSHLDKVSAFQTLKRKEYDDSTKDAANLEALKDAVLFRNDPKAIATSEAEILANTRSKFKGMGTEIIKMEEFKARSNLHRSIVEAYKDNEPSKALDYLKNNKDKIDPLYFEAESKKLDEMVKVKTAKDTASFIAELPLSSQIKALEAIKDPETKNKATKLVRDMNNEKEAMKELAAKQRLEVEGDAVFKDAKNYNVPLDMPLQEQEHLYNLKQKLISDDLARKGQGIPSMSDPNVYLELKQTANDKELKRKTLDYYAQGKLSYAHMQKFIDDSTSPDKFQTVETANSFVSKIIKDTKMDVNEAAFFSEMFERELNNFPETERKKAETLNKVKDSLMINMDVKGSFFDQPLWKTKFKSQEVIAPSEKPKEVPETAKWTEQKADGKTLRGWAFTNAQGVNLFYSVNDKSIYRIDNPKGKSDNKGDVSLTK